MFFDLKTHRYDVFKAGNYAKLSVGAGALSLATINDYCKPASGKFSGTQVERLVVQVSAAPLRWSTGEESPTATDGMLMAVNDVLILDGYHDISSLKLIRTDTTNAVIQVLYMYPA